MVRDTSIKAYNELKASNRLSDLQWGVYHNLYHFGPLTRNETAVKILGASPVRDGVHQRFSELNRIGIIKRLELKRECTVTGKTAYLWDVTSKIPKDADFDTIETWPFLYYVVIVNGDWKWFPIETTPNQITPKEKSKAKNKARLAALAFRAANLGSQMLELKGRTVV